MIRVDVMKGYRLFHIKKYGHSPKGCYRRYGSRKKSMEQDEIDRLYRASVPSATIVEKKSPKEKLTFSIFKIYLNSSHVAFDDSSFDESFGLRREDGAYNYMAYLLSDQFDESIKDARFRGRGESGDLVMRKEFGKGCIFKVFYDLLDYMDSVERSVRTYFDKGLRRDEYLYDESAFVEAWKNAVLHNSYHTNQFPQVYLYDDHLEVMSHGDPLQRMTKEEFLRGKSKPLNEVLMKIAINVELTDQTGKGNKDIVHAYGPGAFEFSENFLTVRIPYNPLALEASLSDGGINVLVNVPVNVPVNFSEERRPSYRDTEIVLKVLRSNPYLSREEIATKLGKNMKTVSRIITALKQEGRLLRIGSEKNGRWIIQNADSMGKRDDSAAIVSFIMKSGESTIAEIAAATRIPERTVERLLSSLKKEGRIMRIGSRKNGQWKTK